MTIGPAPATLQSSALLVVAVLTVLGTPAAQAATLGAKARAELRRGVAAVGPRTSDEPALRQERQTREPSAGFRLGAALGAWTSAAATLAYDLKTPSGDGDDSESIHVDCQDEQAALAHLEAGRRSLGLTPQQVLDGAVGFEPGVLAAWLARQSAAPSGCR